ncbi:MAG: SDR family NAD(P)-dependent oxidoreductase [Acidimicrobiia bacterium]|nr:SDR family NAD(P)-dependent oxidoreductase [Acidimicrobiia bacterium]
MATAVVTGASSGIGLATAVRLAADHDLVWAAVRNPEGATDLAAAVESLPEGRVRVVAMDVDDDESVQAAFATMLGEGPLDVVVNNAGVSGSGPVEEMPLAEFRRQMETNFFGALRCTQAVLPSMRERRRGWIVNMSSLAGRFVRPSMGAYAASKHALEAMSDALAQELAPFDVRVRLIEPGVILTPIWSRSTPPPTDTSYPLAAEKALAYYARMLRTPTPPEEVAEVVAASVADDGLRLRYPVGWDAEAIIARLRTIADEDLVAMAALDTESWQAAWAERFGFDLT